MFLAKVSSQAVISSEPVKSSSTKMPKGLLSFLENFFSTLMTSPASLKLPFSVAWVTWEMVLYFPESKCPA